MVPHSVFTPPQAGPHEMIALLLLLAPFDVAEYFAGVARIAALAKYVGYHSAAVDVEYGKELGFQRGSRPPMDLNSNAGLM